MSILSSFTQQCSQIPGCVSCGVLGFILLIYFSTPFDSTPNIFDTQIFIEVQLRGTLFPGYLSLTFPLVSWLTDIRTGPAVIRVKLSRLWLERCDFNLTIR